MDFNLIQRQNVQRLDWPLVLEWRNDIKLYALMRTNREIQLNEHMLWFDDRSKDFQRYPLLGYYLDEELIAITRIDPTEVSCHEISLIVSPTYRGRGVATFCLNDTVNFFFSSPEFKGSILIAKVHPDNLISIRLFEKNGFESWGSDKAGFLEMIIQDPLNIS